MNIKEEADRRVGMFLDIEPENEPPYYYCTQNAIALTRDKVQWIKDNRDIFSGICSELAIDEETEILEELKSRI